MCGIAGIMTPQPIDPDALTFAARTMADTLIHRGPDSAGTWSNGHVAFAHRRLSIIDIEEGKQPMHTERGTVITYNGEIYNYLEIRQDLEAAGILFHSQSDTEVVLRAFEHWGTACVEHLNGMFAFAIWDAGRRKLFLARDRLGEKPLYYAFGRGGFAFSSEIQGLRTLTWVQDSAEIDAEALIDYMSLGYILTPKTIYRNMRSLPPACWAWVAPGDVGIKPTNYWSLEDSVLSDPIPYNAKTRMTFAGLLESAVSLRLRADVPVGLYLSGGLDSAAIAAEASRSGRGRVVAYTVSFPEASFNESDAARQTAQLLGMPITVIPSGVPELSLIPDLVRHSGQPFADTSSGPTYLLNKAAAPKVKVALSGDGGDEVLAGYPTYQADRLQTVYRHIPGFLGKGMERLVALTMRPSYRKLSYYYKLRRFLAAAGLDREEAHYWWRVVFDDKECKALLSPTLHAAAAGYHPKTKFLDLFRTVNGNAASFLRRAQYVDIKTWLVDDILVKTDRFSMAHSVEVRTPFLDHRLVEFCLRLEDRAKIAGTQQKVILRDIMAEQFPKNILRRRKQGFGAPTKQLGVLKSSAAGQKALNPAFRLNPRLDDVTYKSFSLAMLNAWFNT